MRVLLLEPDSQVRALVRRCLEPEGHEVFALASADQALAVLRSRPVDLVVCAVEPGGSEGASFVRQVRGVGGGVAALLLSAFHVLEDPEIGAAMSAFTRADFLSKPVTPTALTEHLRRLLGLQVRLGSPAGQSARVMPATTVLPDRANAALRASPPRPAPPPPRAALDQRNLHQLARLWVNRATGTLCVSGAPGGVEGWASLHHGAPVDEESRRLLAAALGGGELLFEQTEVSAPADAESMVSMLWSAAQEGANSRFALDNRFQALTRTSWTASTAHLPLSSATRRLLAIADGQLTLGEALAREGVAAEQVSVELQALVRLRLVSLQAPVAAPARRQEPVAAPMAGYSGEASLPRDRPSWSSSTSGAAGRPPGPSSMGSAAGRPAAAPSSASGASRSGSLPTSGSGAHGSAAPSHSVPRLGSGASQPLGSRSAARSAHARAQLGAALLGRLRREAGDLGAASPAVVLGVPADADAALVQDAAARMRARYLEMTRDESLPAEARDLAAQILEKVEDAARNFFKARAAQGAAALDENRLLAAARELIAQRKWDQAERVLARARQLRADHAGVLANLGWAVYHNPARPVEARTAEARELLALAEQFDPYDGEGQYYLAELLYRGREFQAALSRADRAVRARPDHAESVSLSRRVRARLAATD